jgi:hypothetical protein
MLKSVKIILTTLSNQGTAEDVLQLSPLNILPGREPRWIVDKKKGKTKSYLFITINTSQPLKHICKPTLTN